MCMIYIKGETMKNKLYSFFDIIFYIVSLFMIMHFGIVKNGWLSIMCLWMFILYHVWWDISAKNKNAALIPLYLYVIGYYVIRWDSICEVANVFWKGIFG